MRASSYGSCECEVALYLKKQSQRQEDIHLADEAATSDLSSVLSFLQRLVQAGLWLA